ncbi:hypothetical protein OKA04_17805 [Luteolibacter flavescens]|uniref:ABC transporter permease n=1 Tax=Luteolibacter flavescens TaxID=1859460 RepID=A0ABT3FSN8_9BACT|nr:hypothetical protein [Luteolibacter flavescens]MCW1886598.1 hypothetical protein [Luteolibacter flavescens]
MISAPEFPSLWNVFANPVFRRHAVARLRLWRVVAWVVVSQVIAAFAWSVAVLGYLHTRSRGMIEVDFASPEFQRLLEKHGSNAFMCGWLAILVIQGILVVLKGTFSVATGVAREANEGMIESQRLSPVSTGHKVIGQLLGLPLFENVLVILLLPWAVASAWLGGLSFVMMGKVYLIFATSVLFHHAVGLVAGTLIRQKILAGTISQVLVMLLHFVLPFFGGFGISLISHLGMESAILYEIIKATPQMVEPRGFIPSNTLPPPVDFFRWEIAVSGYHWIITVTALVALLAMLARRWNDQESQLLGKIGTTVLAAWMLTLTCGELLPNFSRGLGLSDLIGAGRLGIGVSADGFAMEGILWIAGFAIVLGMINLLLSATLVPTPEAKARSRYLPRSRWWSDGRSSMPWVVLVSLFFAFAWCLVIRTLLRETPAMSSVELSVADALWVTASLVVPACASHALVLWRGWKVALFSGFTLWMVPLMVSVVGLLMSASPDGWPMWVAGLSGFVLPGYASFAEVMGLPVVDFGAVFHTSLALHAVAAGAFLFMARRKAPVMPPPLVAKVVNPA